MTALAETARGATPDRPAIDRLTTGLGLAVLAVGAVLIAEAASLRLGALFLIGAALGAVLYHAAFGFTGGWRAFIRERRGEALRSQMLMLAIASAVMLPLIATGSVLGRPVGGFQGPIGVSLVAGAAMFGLGMQLGGGCGSGTLFTVGGGSVRMLITLAFFIVGSVVGVAHLPWWLGLPGFGAVRIWSEIGLWPTILLQWAALAAIAWGVTWAERRRTGRVASITAPAQPGMPLAQRLTRGPWPLAWGAVALALLNLLTLSVAGHPWGITSGFALWGAKIYAGLGADIGSWWPGGENALGRSVLSHTVSVMDFGLILGAMIAAGLAGRFAPAAKLPLGSVVSAIVGGFLMGYGARLSFGCNIGALFGGIASGSLHGWIWFAAAFAGSWAGVRFRPALGFRD